MAFRGAAARKWAQLGVCLRGGARRIQTLYSLDMPSTFQAVEDWGHTFVRPGFTFSNGSPWVPVPPCTMESTHRRQAAEGRLGRVPANEGSMV